LEREEVIEAVGFLFSIIRTSTPVLFASFGGLFSERSGVINIALEGFMLVGAFVGAVAAWYSGSAWIGLSCAMVAGILFALFYGFVVVYGKANQVVAGAAMNLLAMGMIPFTSHLLFGSSAGTPSLPPGSTFSFFPFLLLPLVAMGAWAIFRFPFGLWLSFAGECPEALDAMGVSVRRVRMMALILCGTLASLGGATLSLCLSSGYSRNMVAGRGFIALAALILGKWKPLYVVVACLFMGTLEAFQIWLQSSEHREWLPSELIFALPYLFTLIVLAGFVGKSLAPKALGVAEK